MSQENGARCCRLVDGWLREDAAVVDELVSDAIVIDSPVAQVEGRYHGREGLQRWWQDLVDVFPDWNGELVDVRALGEATLARFRITAHGGKSGARVEPTRWMVTRWEDGRAAWVSWHATESEAIEAVRLSD